MDFDPRYDTSPIVSYGQVHVKLFTVFKKSGLPELSFATELPETLVQVLRKFDRALSLMVLHSVGLNDVKLSTVKKVDFKNTKCKFCEPRFKRM